MSGPAEPRKPLSTLFWGIAGFIALLVLVGIIVIARIFYGLAGLPNAYALWDASELVILHIDRTKEWPRSWEDLKPDTERYPNRGPETFAEIQQRVRIDFGADLETLRAAQWQNRSSPPFVVIRKVSGPSTLWVEPNEEVWRYLHGERGTDQRFTAPTTLSQ